jgi:hypothetical protein
MIVYLRVISENPRVMMAFSSLDQHFRLEHREIAIFDACSIIPCASLLFKLAIDKYYERNRSWPEEIIAYANFNGEGLASSLLGTVQEI